MSENKSYILSKLASGLDAKSAESICKILFEDIPDIGSLTTKEVDNIIERLVNDEPIQYVTGLAPFFGYFFKVDNNVLIPRPETEELVYTVEKYMKKKGLESARILDVGTGSGCIPITLSKLFVNSQIIGIDVSEGALEIARSNNSELGSSVSFQLCDFLDHRSWKDLGQFDIIISNPPYIPNEEKQLMSSNVLDHEPHLALFVEDEDPLLFYKQILNFAKEQSSDVTIFMECNEYNAPEVATLFEQSFNSEIIKDLQAKDRIVMATSKI